MRARVEFFCNLDIAHGKQLGKCVVICPILSTLWIVLWVRTSNFVVDILLDMELFEQ